MIIKIKLTKLPDQTPYFHHYTIYTTRVNTEVEYDIDLVYLKECLNISFKTLRTNMKLYHGFMTRGVSFGCESIAFYSQHNAQLFTDNCITPHLIMKKLTEAQP